MKTWMTTEAVDMTVRTTALNETLLILSLLPLSRLLLCRSSWSRSGRKRDNEERNDCGRVIDQLFACLCVIFGTRQSFLQVRPRSLHEDAERQHGHRDQNR